MKRYFSVFLTLGLLLAALMLSARAEELPAPQELAFAANRLIPVFLGPDEDCGRAANGRAAVSTNGPIRVYGVYEGWALIGYEIDAANARIGWIEAAALPQSAAVPALELAARTAYLACEAAPTDDPLQSQRPIFADFTLPEGSWITWQATLDGWALIESSTGDWFWAFVPLDSVTTDRIFHLADWPGDDGRPVLDGTVTVSAEGLLSAALILPEGGTAAAIRLYDGFDGTLLCEAKPEAADVFLAETALPAETTSLRLVAVSADGSEADEFTVVAW